MDKFPTSGSKKFKLENSPSVDSIYMQILFINFSNKKLCIIDYLSFVLLFEINLILAVIKLI